MRRSPRPPTALQDPIKLLVTTPLEARVDDDARGRGGGEEERERRSATAGKFANLS